MKKEISFYENWYDSFPFKHKIYGIVYNNFLKEQADRDSTYFTRLMSFFYSSKYELYVKRFDKKISQMAKAIQVGEKAVITHLLFEVRYLHLHYADVAPSFRDRIPYRTINEPRTVLKNLSTLQYFKNLEGLSCYGQDIFDLAPLLNFPCLKELTLWSDRILDSEVELINASSINKLHRLCYLDLSGNFISNFQEITNPAIEYLNLSYTNLESLRDLSSLCNLKFLEISQTKLDNLHGIEVFKDLEVLRLDSNQITDYSLILNLPKLKLITYYDLNEQTKSELLKLKEQNRSLSLKDEYSFDFYKWSHRSIEEVL